MNASHVRKPIKTWSHPSDVTLESRSKMFHFSVHETTDPTVLADKTVEYSVGAITGSIGDTNPVVSVRGEDNTFIKYFPNRDTRICFEVCIEDPVAKGYDDKTYNFIFKVEMKIDCFTNICFFLSFI